MQQMGQQVLLPAIVSLNRVCECIGWLWQIEGSRSCPMHLSKHAVAGDVQTFTHAYSQLSPTPLLKHDNQHNPQGITYDSAHLIAMDADL